MGLIFRVTGIVVRGYLVSCRANKGEKQGNVCVGAFHFDRVVQICL